ncbi:MAG: hypothetical protein M3143_12830 [Actinomycetota bacterium]|nr:hypothetical protein [Actinomycetota bacterium]
MDTPTGWFGRCRRINGAALGLLPAGKAFLERRELQEEVEGDMKIAEFSSNGGYNRGDDWYDD